MSRYEDDEEFEENEEDITCCHRATFCNPYIRSIKVTDPIFSVKGETIYTWANLFWLITCISLVLMAWAVLFFLVGDPMLPPGHGFGLFALVIFSYTLGWTLAYIPYLNLPPVFGMLLAGIIFRNTDFYDIQKELGRGTTAKIRTCCLTFILLRAGLSLTTTALKENPLFVVSLALLPCSVEMLVLTICARSILGYPWEWAFMTGAIVSCMSPVVTVNCILALAEHGYGEDKGLASILCAATSIDDIHILSLFSIFYSIIFTNDYHRKDWLTYIPSSIRDLLLGIVVGLTLGFFFMFFPHRNHAYVIWYRLSCLVFAALMCTTAASRIAVTGGGYVATILMSFIAITGWRILTENYDTIPLKRTTYFMWHFMQPILVGVIGADIDFRDWSLIRFGYYVTTVTLGILIRAFVAFLTTLNTNFTWKESIFIALAWTPKGTVQAALAPMAYESARLAGNEEQMELALDIVRLSVVSIVFLAPLGAILMMTSGPILLNKMTEEEHQRHRELSFLRIMSLQPVRVRRETMRASMVQRAASVRA